MTRQTHPVPGWAQAAVLAGLVIVAGLLSMMVSLASKNVNASSSAPMVALVGVVAIVAVAATWTARAPAVSTWARLAIVLTAAQLGIAVAAWVLWVTIAPTVDGAARQLPLVESLPAPPLALFAGVIVILAASFARRRRTGAPRWLNVVVVFALAHLLLLALWLPIAAAGAPPTNTMLVDVRPWIGDQVATVLAPPVILAGLAAAFVERYPAWMVRWRRELSMATGITVLIGLAYAIGARSEATPGTMFMYGNFVHVLFSAAMFALLALAALAWSHARGLAAGRVDRARTGPWVQEGEVVVEPGAEPVVGHVVYQGVLGGLRTSVGRFVLRTASGDLPVPAGARLDAALPLSTLSAKPGDHLPVLRAGQRVVVTGFVEPDPDSPFRESALLAPGPRGLVVTAPRAWTETPTRDILLLVWRPCAVFLVVVALAAIPGLFSSHAPTSPPPISTSTSGREAADAGAARSGAGRAARDVRRPRAGPPVALALCARIWRIRPRMPIVPGLRVIRSPIHGYGVVAQRPFAKGEVIIRAEGFIYAEDESFDDTYALVLPTDDLPGVAGEQIYYDLVDQSRWINHSCEPNTEVESALDPDSGQPVAWWVATRDIAAGEELVYDYAFVGALAEPCGCGAATCRGLIVDPDPEELAAVPEHLRHHLRIAAAQRVAS